MKNYLFFYKLGGAGVGCDATGICYFEVDDPEKVMENPSVNDVLWEMACDNAESFGVYPTPDFEVEEDEEDNYSDDIYGHAVPFDPEKHGGKLSGGGHWKTHIDEPGAPVFEDGYWVLDTSKEAIAKNQKDRELKSVDEAQYRLEKKMQRVLAEAERIERERVYLEKEILALKLKARKLVAAGAEMYDDE